MLDTIPGVLTSSWDVKLWGGVENCSRKSTHNTRWYENCSLKTRTIPGGIKTVLWNTLTIPGGIKTVLWNTHNTRWYKYILRTQQWGRWNPRGLVLYQASGAASILTESRPSPGDSRGDSGEGAILESWCYTRRNGAASIQVERRPIPGNSRWCSTWLSSREGGDVSFYTSGQQASVVWFEVLRLYQGSVVDGNYQIKSRFCL